MSPIFPQEIETEILVRLPAKSLQRCKSVCKSWNSLITSDVNFISLFHRRATKNPQLMFLKHPRLSPIPIHFSLAVPENQTLIETTPLLNLPNNVIAINSELKPSRIDLINSNLVNGVLGIIVYMGFLNGPVVECDMYMWNVGTSETVKLPVSGFTGLFDGPPMVKFYSGFGYDKMRLNYKVVRVVCVGSSRLRSEVYSLRRNRWKKLKFNGGITSNTLWASEMCTFVNGVGYWGVYKSERKDGFSVLGFCFVAEKFKKLSVPEVCVDGREKKYQSLWEFRGDLALSVLHFGGFESGFSRHYVWLFKQNGEGEGFSDGWNSLFNIDLECGPRRPVVSLMSGELVLLGEDDGEHVLYDTVSGQVMSLGVSDVDHVLLYVEGLTSLRSVLPDEGSCSLWTEESISRLLPEEAISSLLPEEASSSLLPEEAISFWLPEKAISSLLPKDASSGLLSEEAISSLLPKEASSILLREEAISFLLPKEASCFLLHEEAKASSSLLPEEAKASSSLLPEEASTSLLPNEASSSLVLKEASSSSLT